MSHLNRNHKFMASRFGMIVTALALIMSLASCNQAGEYHLKKLSKRPLRHRPMQEPPSWKLPNPAIRLH